MFVISVWWAPKPAYLVQFKVAMTPFFDLPYFVSRHRLKFITLGVIGLFALIAPTSAPAVVFDYIRPPNVAEIETAQGRAKWHSYFAGFSGMGPYAQNLALDTTSKDFVAYIRNKNSEQFLRTFQPIRKDLPIEFRWILSAIETGSNRPMPETVSDARNALKNARLYERTSLSLRRTDIKNTLTFRRDGEPANEFSHQRDFQLLEDVTSLYRNWQIASASAPDAAAYEQDRLRWINYLYSLAGQTSIATFNELLKDFERPGMRDFTSASKQREFFKMVSNCIDELINKNGYYRYHVKREYTISSWSEIELNKSRAMLRDWITKDLEFSLVEFTDLNNNLTLRPNDIFNRIADPELRFADETVLQQVINAPDPKKIKVDSFVIAHLLASNLDIVTSSSQVQGLAAYEIIFKAAQKPEGMQLNYLGLEKKYVLLETYSEILKEFLKIYRTRHLDAGVARRLLSDSVPKLAGMSEDEWANLEWQRLECAENALDSEEFKSALIAKYLGETSSVLDHRLMVAKYLRTKLKVTDLNEIAMRLKLSTQGSAKKDFKTDELTVWEKQNAQLVRLVMMLNPKDADLDTYLVSVFVKNRVDGPLGAHGAISLLEQTGTSSDLVREELVRRLQYVGSGDSAGNFEALLKLYPATGQSIVDIVYRHRTAPEKLKPMLLVLLKQIAINPSLLESIRNGLKRHPEKNVSSALYQGHTLDNWLDAKKKFGRAEAAKALSCAAILSSSKSGALNEK